MMSAAINYYPETDDIAPADRLIALCTALLLHGIVIAVLWQGIQSTQPVLSGIKQSFEMVDLSPYLKQQKTKTAKITAAKEQPKPAPEPKVKQLLPPPKATSPQTIKLKKTIAPKPKSEPKPELKPEPEIQARPKPKAVAKNIAPALKKTDTPIQQSTVNKQPLYRAPSTAATYLHNPKPHYPRIAKLRGMEGIAKLRVKVGIDGRAIRVDIQTSSGFSALDEAAVKAVRHWRFEPARRGSIKVTGDAIVAIQFQLDKT